MQDRIGANRADIVGITVLGLLHPLADVIKLLSKEDVVPTGANRVMHLIAPLIAAVPAVIAYAVIPFGGVYTFGDTHALAGRRRPRLGPALHLRDRLDRHLRRRAGRLGEQQQLVAARRPARLGADDLVRGHDGALGRRHVHGASDAASSPDMARRAGHRRSALFGFLEHLFGVAGAAAGSTGSALPAWGIFYQPLGFIMFLTAIMAENKRPPFDLPEGESELDRRLLHSSTRACASACSSCPSSSRWSVIAGLVTTLFLGGWSIP